MEDAEVLFVGEGPGQNEDEQAKDVGYPIILKPVAGGGGKGMLIANSEDDLLWTICTSYLQSNI